jgi:NTP pyrophosphatase (non-canonical NTP hydrolase)
MLDAKKMNEWRDKIHTLAIGKGWYEGKERTRLSLIMLINSEVYEAYECWRKKEDLTYFDENGKPCGLPSELADVVIRLFDMAGYFNVDFEDNEEISDVFDWEIDSNVLKDMDFEKFCSNVATDMFDWEYGDFIYSKEYYHTIKYIYYYCVANGVDLEKEMLTKHEFNKTRSKRHGGKRS